MIHPSQRTARKSLWRIFALPFILAVSSIAGLILALTGDGFRDLVSVVLLSIPITAFAIAWAKRS